MAAIDVCAFIVTDQQWRFRGESDTDRAGVQAGPEPFMADRAFVRERPPWNFEVCQRQEIVGVNEPPSTRRGRCYVARRRNWSGGPLLAGWPDADRLALLEFIFDGDVISLVLA